MPIVFNTGKATIPRIPSQVYSYTNMANVPVLEINKRKVVVNIQQRIGESWKYIENNCAKNKKCNDYFATLQRNQTLTDIMQKVTFTAHLLAPKKDHTDDELPLANSAGMDIGFCIFAFIDTEKGTENSKEELAATILHELAHYAGATTNARDTNALAAENSLIHCGLQRFFSEEHTG